MNRCEYSTGPTSMPRSRASINSARPVPRLENAASQASGRFLDRSSPAIGTQSRRCSPTITTRTIAVTSWAAESMVEMPRSPSVQVQADLGVTHAAPTVIAVRGERLTLSRVATRVTIRADAFRRRDADHLRNERRRPVRSGRRVRPRRHRRRLRGTRHPLPRRRSGRPLAHVVGYFAGLRRAEPARAPCDDAGLGECRPPPLRHNRAKCVDPEHPCLLGHHVGSQNRRRRPCTD